MLEYLNDMALFVEAVKAGGFRRAADALGVPNSTLSRRISLLEKSIGLRLLHRTTRRMELTEAGRLYFERCKHIVQEARMAHEQLNSLLEHPSGTLRASLPVDFAVTYLARLITEFAQSYPAIDFDFDFTPRRVDLVREPFDVAIRMGEPEDSLLIARPLARLQPCLYASADYLARAGTPTCPQELTRHACFNVTRSGIWRLHHGSETIDVPVSSRYQLNSIGMIRRLAVLGEGIILMPYEVIADELQNEQLLPLLPDWRGVPLPVYAMTETRLLPAKTQRFIEFLRDRLAQSVWGSTRPPDARAPI